MRHSHLRFGTVLGRATDGNPGAAHLGAGNRFSSGLGAVGEETPDLALSQRLT